KSTRGDLAWLREQGWEPVIRRHLRYGGTLLGICGGFQMLGRAVHDPDGLEGPAGSSHGFGLLVVETRLVPGKQLRNVRGRLVPGGASMQGYEIHVGVTQGPGLQSPLLDLDGRPDGAVSADGQVMGCYPHGLFDLPSACQALLRRLGMPDTEAAAVDYQTHRMAQLDRLADSVERELDTAWLRRTLRLTG
ncbi:MAG: cobyric acid synthase CobQ, partial [Ectothiorhodospiraceae bacterium]|nr:cobyric acid synthase CobQ [Ectothiorhodospiraceae bacterium]